MSPQVLFGAVEEGSAARAGDVRRLAAHLAFVLHGMCAASPRHQRRQNMHDISAPNQRCLDDHRSFIRRSTDSRACHCQLFMQFAAAVTVCRRMQGIPASGLRDEGHARLQKHVVSRQCTAHNAVLWRVPWVHCMISCAVRSARSFGPYFCRPEGCLRLHAILSVQL